MYRASIGIRVPRLIAPLSTGDITAMSAEAGVKVTEAFPRLPIRRARIAGQLIEALVAVPLFSHAEEAIFHADPHAGNLLYDETNRELVVLDWALAERLRKEGSEFLVKEPGPLLSDQADQEQWERVRTIVAAQSPDAIAAAALGIGERADSTPDLPGIDVPTMVVTSTGDTLIPPEQTTPMADAIPGATLELIEGAGHLSSMEWPGEFTLLLERHLTLCGLL